MNLDIRVPIGMLFLLLGVLLVGQGVLGDPTIYRRSLNININLWWGVVLLVFGGAMLFFGRRAVRRVKAPS
jgi:hypothetical protein